MANIKILKTLNISILNIISLILISILSFSCINLSKNISNTSEDQTENVSSNTKSGSYNTDSSIHVIDANTFRIDESFPIVWDTMLSVLIRNYNIIVVNQESGIITTDWDSFYLKEHTIRNRITVKIKKLAFKNTEIIFHNSVEKLKVTAVYNWVPEPDKYGEVGRIMNNIAIMLNQPPIKTSLKTEGDIRRIITR